MIDPAELDGILTVKKLLGASILRVHRGPDACKGDVQTQQGRYPCRHRADHTKRGALCEGPCVPDRTVEPTRLLGGKKK